MEGHSTPEKVNEMCGKFVDPRTSVLFIEEYRGPLQKKNTDYRGPSESRSEKKKNTEVI